MVVVVAVEVIATISALRPHRLSLWMHLRNAVVAGDRGWKQSCVCAWCHHIATKGQQQRPHASSSSSSSVKALFPFLLLSFFAFSFCFVPWRTENPAAEEQRWTTMVVVTMIDRSIDRALRGPKPWSHGLVVCVSEGRSALAF